MRYEKSAFNKELIAVYNEDMWPTGYGQYVMSFNPHNAKMNYSKRCDTVSINGEGFCIAFDPRWDTWEVE